MATSKADSLKEYYGMSTVPKAPEALEASKEQEPETPTSQPTLDELTTTRRLGELLQLSSERLDAVRDLYADRQSLVYNHHQELVGASETVGEMRRGIEALVPSRTSLAQQLEQMRRQPTEPAPVAPAPEAAMPWKESIEPIVQLPLTLRRILDQRTPTCVADAEAALQAHTHVLQAWVEARVAGADELQRVCHDMIAEVQRTHS
ncbi:hypothetical protein MEQU1_001133 [Malassezia equina]|uniref:Vacuolar protein sorting-associated protein 51 homolog n=1 Tax=Malassezia equina TaxID=1381935 RepID=A0AAF0IY37_9BASI|nr:hypothetical protein MEQU1_001133 [Malassezia equina]